MSYFSQEPLYEIISMPGCHKSALYCNNSFFRARWLFTTETTEDKEFFIM